jgi:hypothetical protein
MSEKPTDPAPLPSSGGTFVRNKDGSLTPVPSQDVAAEPRKGK